MFKPLNPLAPATREVLLFVVTLAVAVCVADCELVGSLPVRQQGPIVAYAVAALVLVAFSRSMSNLFTILFIVDVSLVFLIAYPQPYLNEGALLFLIIIGGFLLGRTLDAVTAHSHTNGRSLVEGRRTIPTALTLGVSLQVICWMYQVVAYGPIQYYSGASMANAIQKYASGGSSGLAINALQYVAVILSISGIALYAKNLRPSPWLIGFVLIVIPLISLQRGNIVAGLMCCAYIYRSRLRLKHLAAFAVFGVGISVVFGGIRQEKLGSTTGLSLFQAVAGELSVAEDVHLIAKTVRDEGIAGGKTLVGPIVTMPVPRSLYPNKPELTSAIIMQEYFPDEAESGYYLAPTIFGDWLFNFGYVGVLLVSLGIGFIVRKMDTRPISVFGVVVSYYFYPTLRNNTAQSLLFIIACLCIAYTQQIRPLRRFYSRTPTAVLG